MIDQKVMEALEKSGVPYEINEFSENFKSTENAAELLGIEVSHIAKCLVYKVTGGICVLILAGDKRVDKHKYKDKFKTSMHRLNENDLMELTGFVPGAVTPIGITYEGAEIYMDESLRPFLEEQIYPSGGTLNSAIGIKTSDLYRVALCKEWIDISV